MKIYQMQTIATVLWVLMGLFFALTVVLFFVWNIRKAWKIVVGTNFKVPVIKGFWGPGSVTGYLGTRNLGSRNLSSKRLASASGELKSKKLNATNDAKSRRLNSKNLDSRRLSAGERRFNHNADSRELNSKKLVAGRGKTGMSYSGVTVALDRYRQSVEEGKMMNIQTGMENTMETAVLVNQNLMKTAAGESEMTAVLKREELEMVVDIMFIHTEEI